MPTHWLSYGGGVNSTALAILLAEGKLPELTPWRAIFSDTKDEKDGTYAYIRDHFGPWLEARGVVIETTAPPPRGSRLLAEIRDGGVTRAA